LKEILVILAKHGPFAVISGGLIYLFVLVWKRFNELFQQQHDALLEDTKAKAKLTEALEDTAASVEALGVQTGTDVAACKAVSAEMIKKVDDYIHERKLEQAKEEARREVTGRFKLPPGGEE
jgi:hypothetical protein